VPDFPRDLAARIVDHVREVHEHIAALRSESDAERAAARRARATWLRGQIETLVGQALGVTDDEVALSE